MTSIFTWWISLRILFVHEVDYLSKPIFEMHDFPELLAARGHEVGFLHFPESTKKIFRHSSVRLTAGRSVESASITLFEIPSIGLGLLSRFVSALLSTFYAQRILNKYSPDLVVTYAVPTFGWQFVKACRRLSIPIVYRAIDLSHAIRKTRLSGLIKTAERFVIRKSSAVFCNSPILAEYCKSISPESRVVPILPPLDVRLFSERSSRLRIRSELGIAPDSRVYLFLGTFFRFSGLDDLIESFADNRSLSDVLLLIGGGEAEKDIRSLVERNGMSPFVFFTGFVDYKDLPSLFSAADCALNPMQPIPVAHYALPNKVLQYLAAGLPVVSTSLLGLRSVLPAEPDLIYVDFPSEVFPAAQQLLGASEAHGSTRERLKKFDSADKVKILEREFEALLLEGN